MTQKPPKIDSFWRGYLAFNEVLDWQDLPYLTPRIITNPRWIHPNINDFSFVRIAVVSFIILQSCGLQSQKVIKRNQKDDEIPEFTNWKQEWLAEAKKPKQSLVTLLCRLACHFDNIFPITRHREVAIDWLLRHQEEDGSFFSSVHMTSIAIVALHKNDPVRFKKQVESGVNCMRKWQVVDEKGRRRQQFSDSTMWDTMLGLDLLVELDDLSSSQVQNAYNFILRNQGTISGDWSFRTRYSNAGGWSFQRIGRWYPDCDDTAIALNCLLKIGGKACLNNIYIGVKWLLAMQWTNGGWASWDRNDRSWMQIPDGGRWFARDLVSAEITARIIIILHRIINLNQIEFNDLIPDAQKAIQGGMRWLRRNKQNGIWFGRWFTHYLYGTCHVLEAYKEIGYTSDHPEIQIALNWLIKVRNPDGGYGESSLSSNYSNFVPAPSTPFHTACALMGLIYAGAANHPVAYDAAKWLLSSQNIDGSWKNMDFFAAGLPGVWYANFEFTSTYYAAKSLLLFKKNLN